MAEPIKLKEYFGLNLAELLVDKIAPLYPELDRSAFLGHVEERYRPLELKARVKIIAEALRLHLPDDYPEAIEVLVGIMGDPNPNQTGMFKEYYWLLPVSTFIENYGLDHYDESIRAIYELTQRNTGEYAIRPYILQQPHRTLEILNEWSLDSSFHVRRLSSEGIRPKLPWAKKLDVFVEDCLPVFELLENLKEDPIIFVKKSVANNIADYLKLNPEPTWLLINRWNDSDNPHTQWILKHATRRFRKP